MILGRFIILLFALANGIIKILLSQPIVYLQTKGHILGKQKPLFSKNKGKVLTHHFEWSLIKNNF